MARTTALLVGKIVEVDPTITDLSPFIDSANELVTEVCTSAQNEDGSDFYTATRLELIERWLAAHFYKIRDQLLQSEQTGPVQASYGMKLALNLAVTTYGQQAMLLDTFGGLAQLNKATESGRVKVDGFWLGRLPEGVE